MTHIQGRGAISFSGHFCFRESTCLGIEEQTPSVASERSFLVTTGGASQSRDVACLALAGFLVNRARPLEAVARCRLETRAASVTSESDVAVYWQRATFNVDGVDHPPGCSMGFHRLRSDDE